MPRVVVVGQLGAVTEVLLVVVVTVAQPDSVQASQQLSTCPTHAAPAVGAEQCGASRLIEHLVTSFAWVRQHVTKPGLPQVERAAQRLTTPAQLRFARDAFACCAAQRTYAP